MTGYCIMFIVLGSAGLSIVVLMGSHLFYRADDDYHSSKLDALSGLHHEEVLRQYLLSISNLEEKVRELNASIVRLTEHFSNEIAELYEYLDEVSIRTLPVKSSEPSLTISFEEPSVEPLLYQENFNPAESAPLKALAKEKVNKRIIAEFSSNLKGSKKIPSKKKNKKVSKKKVSILKSK